MFKKPVLAMCSDRQTMPKSNLVTSSPEEWYDKSVLQSLNHIGFSFDFFVNWSSSPPTVTPVVWVKRILTVDPKTLLNPDGTLMEAVIESEIIKFETRPYLDLFTKFCTTHKLTLQFILFRDINWSTSPEEIIVVSVSIAINGLHFSFEKIDINELRNRINANSGGAVNMGGKGLIYGTSTLECFLAKTNSLYPGDLDLVVCDLKTLDILALIEFKKHNLDSSIENEKLSNYYPSRDKRKYDRLAILRDYLKVVPRTICVYYPTKTNDNAKIETIEGGVGALKSGKTFLLKLPRSGNIQTYIDFVRNSIV